MDKWTEALSSCSLYFLLIGKRNMISFVCLICYVGVGLNWEHSGRCRRETASYRLCRPGHHHWNIHWAIHWAFNSFCKHYKLFNLPHMKSYQLMNRFSNHRTESSNHACSIQLSIQSDQENFLFASCRLTCWFSKWAMSELNGSSSSSGNGVVWYRRKECSTVIWHHHNPKLPSTS